MSGDPSMVEDEPLTNETVIGHNSDDGSFLAGALPLSLSLSSRQLRLITALGTGVLVGTSLIVIIPEGVETLYSASGSSHSHAERSLHHLERSARPLEAFTGAAKHDVWRRDGAAGGLQVGVPADSNIGFATGPDDGFDAAEAGVTQSAPATDGASDEAGLGGGEDEEHHPAGSGDHEDDARDPHAWVGISLIMGFILMYLVDTLPRHATTPTQPQRFAVSLNQFSFNRSSTSSLPNEAADETPTHDTYPSAAHHHHTSSSRPSSTTVGLVIHAAADGIALGASSLTPPTTGRRHLTLIIFLALMLHKAPAAFGLTSVLLKQGLSKRMARAHLIIFSLAAPVGALLTWAAAHILGYSSTMTGNSGSTEFATGVLLLFSAGTFLYVAMHTMQESGGEHSHAEARGNGYAGVPMHEMYDQQAAPAKGEGGPPVLLDTLVTVGGMLLPLLTQFGHAH
ncbi:hypothetical protein LTR36_001821 [Oleoguttula mirabilis]|uniref:Uncharacterized protein n=1 Tax=Oleoguttula mirabilis TaxID=1507867 RepID=A0AAV9JNL8_9PEZI|nr:hypothetical protein LTR36_001821 [Oleoguttula mirabilis]